MLTYEEFFREYDLYITNYFRRYAYIRSNADDMAQEFKTRFVERDLLSGYTARPEGSVRGWLGNLMESNVKGTANRNRLHEHSTIANVFSYSDSVMEEVFTRTLESDPADIVCRMETIDEAVETVKYLARVLDSIPATDYRRYPSSKIAESERRSLGDVLAAYATDLEVNVLPNNGHNRIGRRDECIGEMLGINRKTANSWESRMIQIAREVVQHEHAN